MKQSEKTHNHQFDFAFTSHGYGAAAFAAKEISEGKTVKFDVFNSGENKMVDLVYKETWYFGKVEVDKGQFAIRQSDSKNLMAPESGSIIPSWYTKEVQDPAYIAARLTLYLMRAGNFWFINNEQD